MRKALNQVHQERVAIVLREVNAWGAAKKHPGDSMMAFSLSWQKRRDWGPSPAPVHELTQHGRQKQFEVHAQMQSNDPTGSTEVHLDRPHVWSAAMGGYEHSGGQGGRGLHDVPRAEANAHSFAVKQKRRHSGAYGKDQRTDQRTCDVLLGVSYRLPDPIQQEDGLVHFQWLFPI